MKLDLFVHMLNGERRAKKYQRVEVDSSGKAQLDLSDVLGRGDDSGVRQKPIQPELEFSSLTNTAKKAREVLGSNQANLSPVVSAAAGRPESLSQTLKKPQASLEGMLKTISSRAQDLAKAHSGLHRSRTESLLMSGYKV